MTERHAFAVMPRPGIRRDRQTKIVAKYDHRSAKYHWRAIDDATHRPGDPIGHGATPQEAARDLIEQIEARA